MTDDKEKIIPEEDFDRFYLEMLSKSIEEDSCSISGFMWMLFPKEMEQWHKKHVKHIFFSNYELPVV